MKASACRLILLLGVMAAVIALLTCPSWAAGDSAEAPRRFYAHENINLRGGPGQQHPVIGRLLPGDTVEVTGSKGEWGELRRSDGKGWVLLSLLHEEPLPPLQIVNWDWRKAPRMGRRGVVVWVVEVRNNTDRAVEHVQAEIRTFDRKGRLLDTAVTHLRGIKPGKVGGSRSFAALTGKEASAQVRIMTAGEENGREKKKSPAAGGGGSRGGPPAEADED